MKMNITHEDKTDLLIFLDTAKDVVKDMKLLPEDEHLRAAIIRRIDELLDKFENLTTIF